MARRRAGVTYDQVKKWALALPGAQEIFVEEWGHPTLRVNNKMFASGSPESTRMSVKASTVEQAELIASDPETYQAAAYTGRYGWVTVDLSRVDPDELRELLVEAWKRTAPKRLVATYEP
jgi:hypothetical protein